MDVLDNISIFDTERSLTVKKSNVLVKSEYSLSLLEQRLILVGVAFIEDINNRTVVIPVSEYKSLLDAEHVNYKHIVDVLKKLRERSIVITKTNIKTGELIYGHITGWVDSILYDDGIIQMRFNEDIWSHLIELKEKYTEYQLKSVLSLKSQYSIRIYEILKSYAYLGYYTMQVEELRRIFVLGDKYSRFNDLQKLIIEPSINEINNSEDIDITISYKAIKVSRRYAAIRFYITKKEVDKPLSEYPPEVQMARSMGESELFSSIKTILSMKYQVIFLPNESTWSNHKIYSRYALEDTYLGLMEDRWTKMGIEITNHKAFFATHLKNETAKFKD